MYVRYHGPADVLEIGDKRLVRGGDAVELNEAEFERISTWRRRQLEVFDEEPAQPEPEPPPRAQVIRTAGAPEPPWVTDAIGDEPHEADTGGAEEQE